MVMGKCTTIHRVTTLRGSGKMIWKKVKEPWTGLICEKSILGNGTRTASMDGEFISGCNLKEKGNFWGTGTRATGQTEWERAMVFFIMPTGRSMRGSGKIIWSKVLLFIPIKTAKFLISCSIKIECSRAGQNSHSNKPVRRFPVRKKLSPTLSVKACISTICFIPSPLISKDYIIYCSETIPSWKLGTRDSPTFTINNPNTVFAWMQKEFGKWSELSKF